MKMPHSIKLIVVLLVVGLLTASNLYAQSMDFKWAKRAGGNSSEKGYDVVMDKSGNSFVIGYFFGTSTFGPYTLTSNGSSDMFIAMYDKDGNVKWVRQIGGTGSDYGRSITRDGSMDLLITGYFQNSIVVGSRTLMSSGSWDILIAKMDASGNIIWARKAGGPNEDHGYSIAVDSDGNSFITGHFCGQATFGTLTLTYSLSSPIETIFVAKYDPSGNILWAQMAGGDNNDTGNGIATDKWNNCIVTGNFYQSAKFGSATLTATGNDDIFIAKYDPNGNLLWVTKAGGSDYDSAQEIDTDGSGNCFITGHFQQTAYFGTLSVSATGSADIYIAKYNSSGSAIWVRKAGGSAWDIAYDINTTWGAKSTITGYFRETAKFGSTTLNSAGSSDIFIAQYDGSGNLLWVKQAGGVDYDRGYGVITDDAGNYIATGLFTQTASFGALSLASSGGEDIYVAKLQESPSITLTKPNGGETWWVGHPYYDITWKSTGDIGEVRIQVSSDNQHSWSLITWSTDDDGVFEWTPAEKHVGTKCWMKVTSTKDLTITDMSNNSFVIASDIGHIAYHARKIPNYMSAPTLDGVFGEAVWDYALEDTMLYGGIPDSWRTPWTNRNDNFVTYKAVWSSVTNKIYVAINIQDDTRGIFDNNIPGSDSFEPWQDECLEFFIDGDRSGGYYDGGYADAQQWFVTGENKIILDDYPTSSNLQYYTGDALKVAVKKGSGGDWTCEAAFEIYDTFPTARRTLAENAIIGWDAWYDDSDNGTYVGGKYDRDHQVGWFYAGPSYLYADYFGRMILDGVLAYIKVTSPNGGENWQMGSDKVITWTSAGTSGNVKIELTRDNGATWEVLCPTTQDDGSKDWHVTGPASNYCKIRISDVDGQPLDESDRVFTISSIPYIIVNSPNGGENWNIGDDREIKWNSFGTSGNVKIELTRDNGSTWEVLYHATLDNGLKTWEVTGPTSDNCKIRISDVDGFPLDLSDNVFSIVKDHVWKVPVKVIGGNTTFTRTFGGGINASNGFDDGLDIVAAPPGMTYYAYFTIPTFPNYLDTDIRKWQTPYDAPIEWTLKIINAQGIVSRLSWDISELPPEGTFTLSHSSTIVNMRSQNSASVSNDASVIIRYSKDVSVKYFFSKQGWYLISLPVYPADNHLSTLFPSAMSAFAYNSVTNVYYGVTTLEPKKGYWLLIPGATTNTISGTPLYSYSNQYGAGWHLIGSVMGTANFSDPNDVPNGSVIAAYGYDPATNQYVPVYPPGTGKLNEGEGYWLAVIQPCVLTIGGSTAAPTAVIANADVTAFYKKYGTQPPIPPFIENQEAAELMPATCIISHNYPNPFNPETTIEYSIPQSGTTQIDIYNALGQKIRTLVNEEQTAGFHRVLWDGRNEHGELVSNGVYFYRIMNANLVHTNKMIMLK